MEASVELRDSDVVKRKKSSSQGNKRKSTGGLFQWKKLEKLSTEKKSEEPLNNPKEVPSPTHHHRLHKRPSRKEFEDELRETRNEWVLLNVGGKTFRVCISKVDCNFIN